MSYPPRHFCPTPLDKNVHIYIKVIIKGKGTSPTASVRLYLLKRYLGYTQSYAHLGLGEIY